jgi:hypothetical protein
MMATANLIMLCIARQTAFGICCKAQKDLHAIQFGISTDKPVVGDTMVMVKPTKPFIVQKTEPGIS